MAGASVSIFSPEIPAEAQNTIGEWEVSSSHCGGGETAKESLHGWPFRWSTHSPTPCPYTPNFHGLYQTNNSDQETRIADNYFVLWIAPFQTEFNWILPREKRNTVEFLLLIHQHPLRANSKMLAKAKGHPLLFSPETLGKPLALAGEVFITICYSKDPPAPINSHQQKSHFKGKSGRKKRENWLLLKSKMRGDFQCRNMWILETMLI